MPRPAAGVSGKGMPGRRHRTADRQPGAGNSHIGLYVRRDAEASQVTVPAPLLRQGFYERAPAPRNECRKAGAPAPAAKAFRALRGCEGSRRRLPLAVEAVFFLSGCSRGAQRTTAESHRPSEGHPHWPGHRKKAFSPDTGRAPAVKGQSGRRERRCDQ